MPVRDAQYQDKGIFFEMRPVRTIVAAAIALLAGIVFAGAATAGDGKKLQFGYPLGSFTAKPHSGGSSHGGSSASRKAKARAAKKAAARKAAARKAAARKAAARKAAAKKAAAKKAAALRRKKAAAKKLAARKAAARKIAAKKASERKAARERIAARKAEELEGGETKNDVIKDDVAKLPGKKPDASSEIDSDNSDTQRRASNSGETCKRYVPSAGLTITVPCD